MCLTYPASSTATFLQSVCFLCLRKEKKEKRSVQRTRVHRDTCFKSSCQQRGLRCSCTTLLPLQAGRERWALSQLLKQRWICSLCDSRLAAHLQEWSCVCIQHCYSVQTSQALMWCRNAFDCRRELGGTVCVPHGCCTSVHGSKTLLLGKAWFSWWRESNWTVIKYHTEQYEEQIISVCLNNWATLQFYTETSGFLFPSHSGLGFFNLFAVSVLIWNWKNL